MVRRFDVCNGDADGLCAVLQWRLHAPAEATLITGLKREIELLQRTEADARAGDEVLVCDLSIQRNGRSLRALLERGVRVRYFDHHAATDIPCHPGLAATIDTGSRVCTSLLVDRELRGAWRRWALVGAYGDNLAPQADALATGLGLSSRQRATLRRLGEAINHNAYGNDERDVHIMPAALYRVLARYRDPLELAACEPIAMELHLQRRDDLSRARALAPYWQDAHGCVHVMPDAPWARRAAGSLANDLARREPKRAHAVLGRTPLGDWRVSVRAPFATGHGAAALCQRFDGSGREAAAGIDSLPDGEFDRFVQAFADAPWHVSAS